MKPQGGVRNPAVIDAVVRAPESGEIVLAMFEDRPWSGETPGQLREKIASYLRFVAGGELYEHQPDARGARLRFDLNVVHEPDAGGWEAIREIRIGLERMGIGFELRRLGPTDSDAPSCDSGTPPHPPDAPSPDSP